MPRALNYLNRVVTTLAGALHSKENKHAGFHAGFTCPPLVITTFYRAYG